MTGARPPSRVRFGPFELDPVSAELWRNGTRVALPPQPVRILGLLASRHGQLVSRQEIREAVWGPDVHVDFDRALNFAIKQIRVALADDSDHPVYVETLRGRGYRFVAAIEPVDRSPRAPGPESAAQSSGPHPPLGRSRLLAAAALVAMVAAAAAIWVSDRRADDRNRIRALAVLPIRQLSPQPGQEFLAEGVTDALIATLGQIRGLRVISRTSTMTYQGTGKTVPQIARELDVDAVVEGSLQQTAAGVRLTLQLIDADRDQQLWTQVYEGADIAALQHAASREIARQVQVVLEPEERGRLARSPHVDARAYEAYLKGRYFWNRRNEADLRRAVALFEEANRIEPTYAPALAGLADAHSMLANYGFEPGDRAWRAAIDAAEAALRLDPDLAEAHASRGSIAMQFEWDWRRAEAALRRAVELNPGYATARHWYGYQLMLAGQFADAERELRYALHLDPLSPIIHANVGFCLFVARRYDEALAHWATTLEMHPANRLVHSYAGLAYVATGRYQAAVDSFTRALASTRTASDVAVLAHTYARMGRAGEARQMLDGLLHPPAGSPRPAYHLALVYLGLGEAELAVEWLERAYAERAGPLNEIGVDPMFDPLRT